MLVETSYTCGHCGEEIVVGVDPTEGDGQEYVEDCPVCCHPHVLCIRVDGGEVSVDARPE